MHDSLQDIPLAQEKSFKLKPYQISSKMSIEATWVVKQAEKINLEPYTHHPSNCQLSVLLPIDGEGEGVQLS